MAGFWDRIKGLVRGRPTASPVGPDSGPAAGPDSAPAAGLDAGLDRLLPLLAAAGLEPTATELGDILWLAAHLDRRPAADPVPRRHPAGAKRTPEPPADPGRPGKAADARPGSAAQGPIEPPPTLDLFPANRPVGMGRAAVGFRAPAEPALPQALAYARALRPLHRRVPSRTRLRLDEEATAERLAEQRTAGHLFWEPVWVPAREPWFELALVLDLGATMVVWRELLDDLRRLCAESGAFRRVRVWGLAADGPEPRLQAGSTQGARACRPESLVGGPERRLVLVASDCIGAAWHSGAVNRWLGLWGDQAPLALLQVLPQRLWEVTALGRGRPVRLRGRGLGSLGSALELVAGPRVPRPLAPGADTPGLRYPVLSLEPAAILGWGRLLGGNPEAWCAGVCFGPQTRYATPAPAPIPAQIRAPADEAELQARIDGFQTASPLSRRLATLLAAVPLTLPVMRLVQRTRLPESGPGNLAEIFASGLLRRHPDLAADGDHPFYDFQGDGRERLLDGLGEAEARAVLEAISGYVAERTGRVLDFAALLAAPNAVALAPAGARIGDANTRHFASVGAGVLRRLGGPYAGLAAGLEALARGDSAGLAGIAGVGADPRTAAGQAPTGPTPFRDPFRDGPGDGPEMVWLPGGTFRMGSPEGVGSDDERPAHEVTLSHYGIGKYPVTLGEFRRFVEATGYRTEAETGDGAYVLDQGSWNTKRDASWRNPYMTQDDQHPVVCVSWNDAKKYCEWLADQTGQTYGLLTEAQWEHACRAGSDTAWCSGDDEGRLADYAWYSRNAGDGTHPVGGRLANPWGLHDLHGNVWEWCADWYAARPRIEAAGTDIAGPVGSAARTVGPEVGTTPGPHSGPYSASSVPVAASGGQQGTSGTATAASGSEQTASENPSGPESGSDRVVRGGAWGTGGGNCRSAYRDGRGPSYRSDFLGFRLSRTGPLHSYPFTLGRAEPAPEPPQPRPADPAQRGSSEPGPAPEPELRPLQGFRDRFVIVRLDGREEPMEPPELVHLPGGTFLMGDERGSGDEKPVHRVRLPAFALGRTPVTWGDYRRFCEATDSHWPEWLERGSQYHLETGANDYYAKRGIGREALDLPVVGVAWGDALAYCEWLRELTGKPYRLPTEAEWEYACRAGTDTRWSCGDDKSKLPDHAWYSANAEGRLHPVAQKRPNPWGLYDMHGNCWEWCSDWYASDYYRQLAEAATRVGSAARTDHSAGPVASGPHSGPYADAPGDAVGASGARKPASGGAADASGSEQPASDNPSGPGSGSHRVVRGGSWDRDAAYCRSAYRHWYVPSLRYYSLGFRLSRTV